MRNLFILLGGILLAVACSKGGDVDSVINEYAGFKDRLCKCADKACADQVAADAEAYLTKMADKMSKMKPTKEQDEKFDQVEDEMEACAKKFEAAADAPPAGDEAAGDEAAEPATP